MVTETRTIIFSDDDLMEALAPMVRRREKYVPKSQPYDIIKRIGRDSLFLLQVTYLTDKVVLTFSEDELFTAVLVHCLKLKIPIPRRAEKVVESRGDEVALIIRIGETN